jgi:N-acetylmuramoyl-L-alanine amidase
MSRSIKYYLSISALLLFLFLAGQTAYAGSNPVLKNGTTGASVTQLQSDLKKLGFMSIEPTGYYGNVTRTAVTRFQKKYGLKSDGIAGSKTLGKISSLRGKSAAVSRGITDTAESMISYAKRFLGVNYVWGGTTPEGFDCSGFIKYVYKHFGISLNRVSSAQAAQGVSVKKSNLLPGDLVFFDTNGGHNHINHVGMYIGGGQFIQASSEQSGVVISSLTDGFYARSFMKAKRVV